MELSASGPTPALHYWLMDNKWHFVSREKERGDREREKKEETHREDGGGDGFFLELFSLGPYMQV